MNLTGKISSSNGKKIILKVFNSFFSVELISIDFFHFLYIYHILRQKKLVKLKSNLVFFILEFPHLWSHLTKNRSSRAPLTPPVPTVLQSKILVT